MSIATYFMHLLFASIPSLIDYDLILFILPVLTLLILFFSFKIIFIRPPKFNSSFYSSSDYRKRFALDTRIGIKYTNENKNNKLYLRLSPRFRLNDHLSVIYVYVQENEKNQFGYISNEKESIFFSRRNQLTFTNKLLIDYAINTKIFTNIIIRHYWSRFENKDFYILNTDGTLSQSNSSNFDSNINFNSDHNNYNNQ